MTVKVSVILPVWNVEKYISKCFDSLLNQTLSDIEIICVNDSSPDNVQTIIDEYAKKDSRIVSIKHEKNKGTAAARQTGLNAARGEYVGFVDPDDYVDLDFFEKLYTLAKEHDADVARGAAIEVYLSGNRRLMTEKLNQITSKNKMKYHGQNIGTGIYRTDMIRKNNIVFVIDVFCFGLQVAFFSNKFVIRNDTNYIYMRREDSTDSQYFPVAKWEKWNINGAKFYLELLNRNKYSKKDYVDLAGNFIYRLHFYGYDKLIEEDRKKASEILTDSLIEFYNNLKYKNTIARKFGRYRFAIQTRNKKILARILLVRHRVHIFKYLIFWRWKAFGIIKDKKQV